MTPLQIMSLVEAAVQLEPTIAALFKNGIKGLTFQSIQTALPQLVPALQQLGATISPAAVDSVQTVVGFIAAFGQGSITKDEQALLNIYLAGTPGFVPLKVDGKYGPATSHAVTIAETKAGINPQGWFGWALAEAIQAASRLG